MPFVKIEPAMKYDDASWHYGGNFPDDLPNEAGATHTGMFVAWALIKELAGQIHTEEFPDALEELIQRRVTPGQFFIDGCAQKFTDEDLTDEGNDFTKAYFDFATGMYLADYETTLAADLPSLYHVADTWESFDRIAPIIDRRFDEWKAGALRTNAQVSEGGSEKKPWWKFW